MSVVVRNPRASGVPEQEQPQTFTNRSSQVGDIIIRSESLYRFGIVHIYVECIYKIYIAIYVY